MTNGLFKRPHGMLAAIEVELGGISTHIPLLYVETNSSYDILLRMD